jgi:hypothetical protein
VARPPEAATLAPAVTDQLEIRGPHGERLLMPVRVGGFVVGSAADADVRVAWPGITPRHFRFVRTDGGVRIEPVQAGGTVAVNGEELFCKDLVAGDVIDVAGVRLRWLPAAPTPENTADALEAVRAEFAAAAPKAKARAAAQGAVARTGRSRAAAGGRAASERPARRARSRGVPTWVLALAFVAVAVLVALLVFQRLGGSTWPRTPAHYVQLAREQFANHNAQQALSTLAFALRDATGETRAEALRLEADIKRILVEAAEMPKVVTARQERDLLLEYLGRYLRDGAGRPAAREFVRQCDLWLQRHREVCTRIRDGQPLVREVEDQRARWLAVAALSEPDTAADVVFAARTRLRFQWRDYRGAFARLDAFLAANPGDATVRAERETLLAEGGEWLRGKLRTVDMLLGRGDVDNAEKDLAELTRRAMLPEWEPLIAERRARLGGSR